MDWETFTERLTSAQSRLHSLRLQFPDVPQADSPHDGTDAAAPDGLLRTLRDLEATFDEFATAQGDLRTQMDQLVEARRDLAEQRRWYRMLFVSAPAAYLVTTPQGVVRDANQQAGALLNVRPRVLIGKPLLTYVAPAQHGEFHDRLHDLETPGHAADDWTLQMRPNGGGRFEASATVVCGTEPAQQTPELQWLIFDVTARRREARELKQANAELEERVAERTRELEAAGRAKDDFLASLSHELRTPVNVIRGFARMLRDGSLDADSRVRAIEAIDRNAARQTRLMADLLDVSRINAGKFTLRCQRIDLRTAVAAARDGALPFAESRQIDLQLRMPDTPAWVWGDAERLQQAFDNLLSNAIKFSPAGSRVEMQLAAEAEAEPEADGEGSHWRVSVRDSGTGIVPEFMPHLFERFRQADVAINIHGGLGLGLSIVRHIIERHGGTVTAHSDGRGRGATFTCILSAQLTGGPGEPPVS